MNPRNVGVIENPDGYGKVGNPVCILPETQIMSSHSSYPIQSVKIGDKVLSHDGKSHNVNKQFINNYNSNILMIKNRLGKTFLTPDHLVYAFKVPNSYTYLYNKNKRKLSKNACWLHSSHLEKNDIIMYPISRKIKDVEYIKISSKRLNHDYSSVKIPPKLKVDKNFMRFAGYFLSEGSTRSEKCRTYSTITFNINEKNYIKDCINIIKKVFGLDAIIEERVDKNTIHIHIYNVHLTRFLRKLFGHSVDKKSVPSFMMLLPLNKQKELIKGLWYGDGHIDKERFRASYATVSQQLSQQVKTLLLRQNIIPSIYEEKSRIINGVKHRKAYRIYVLETPSLKKLISILDIDFNFRDKTSCNAWIENGLLFTPITEIKQIEYSGPVYNLEVKDSHSYTTDNLLVHNCGDLMEMYIKVENDIIKDIKFKTFGCGSAIATSSMVTELAIGKNVDEALKITRKDVANELDGLPPQKMHCSNLAADALHAAIQDYKKKKGGK